jgi:hypothetical protein
MVNPRPEDKVTQSARDTVRRLGESTAEETRRMEASAAEAGQNLARVGADVMQRNAEVVQSALRFGLEMTTAVMGRSTDQFSRMFGLSGNEAQQAAERSTRGAASILHARSTAAKGMSGMSQEYFAFVRHQIENAMDRMNELSRCRTPQEFAALQADFMRDTIESAIQSGRRIADMSLKLADDTTTQMTSMKEDRAA